jgi:hypothetical protein
MLRKRRFKEFDLDQVPLPDNQASTESNSQTVTNSPKAGFLQALTKRHETISHRLGRSDIEETNNWHRLPLRVRRERPCNG